MPTPLTPMLETQRPGRRRRSRGARRRLIPLLAVLIALRALVPVGYMVSVPTAAGGALGLALCPLQNPALDLSKLAAADAHAGHGHAHGHKHGSHTGAADAPDSITVSSGECGLWLASTAPATPVLVAAAPIDTAARGPAPAPPAGLRARTAFHSPQPRAPPAPVV